MIHSTADHVSCTVRRSARSHYCVVRTTHAVVLIAALGQFEALPLLLEPEGVRSASIRRGHVPAAHTRWLRWQCAPASRSRSRDARLVGRWHEAIGASKLAVTWIVGAHARASLSSGTDSTACKSDECYGSQ